MNSILRGIWSGLIATSTMTTALFKFHQSLPETQQSPLPPAKLTTSLLRHLPGGKQVSDNLSSETQMQATMGSHFAFGAGTGLLYALVAPKMKGTPLVKGTLFGLGVWGASYLGWIPAFGLKPQAQKMTLERNAMMVLAHLVWGATLGYNENQMRHRAKTLLDGRRNALLAE